LKDLQKFFKNHFAESTVTLDRFFPDGECGKRAFDGPRRTQQMANAALAGAHKWRVLNALQQSENGYLH
jgi:hypothetical protein